MPVSNVYEMPRPGPLVLFRHALSDTPCYAIVTGTGDRSIDCNVVVPAAMSFLVKNAVRHVRDPDKDKFVSFSDGYWEQLPSEAALEKLLAAFPDIMSRLEDLEAGLASLAGK